VAQRDGGADIILNDDPLEVDHYEYEDGKLHKNDSIAGLSREYTYTPLVARRMRRSSAQVLLLECLRLEGSVYNSAVLLTRRGQASQSDLQEIATVSSHFGFYENSYKMVSIRRIRGSNNFAK